PAMAFTIVRLAATVRSAFVATSIYWNPHQIINPTDTYPTATSPISTTLRTIVQINPLRFLSGLVISQVVSLPEPFVSLTPRYHVGKSRKPFEHAAALAT